MPVERKADLRVQKTRKAIKDAFKELIMQKKASEISIKELAERAMIHRKTFYLHYSCIEALYEEILSELGEGYFQAIDKISADAPFTEANRVFFEFMAAQEPFMEKLVLDSSYQQFADDFFRSMLLHNRKQHNPYATYPDAAQNIINTFSSVGSANLYRQWLRDKKRLPLEALIELSGKLLNSGIASLKS